MKKCIIVLMLIFCIILPTIIVPVSADGHNPYDGFSAREIDEAKIANSSSTAEYLGGMWANDWACYKNLDFGKVSPYAVDLYTGTPAQYAGSAELRLDSPTGPAIAVFNPILPSNWTVPLKQTTSVLTKIVGVHDLYIVSTSGTASFFKIQFHKIDNEEKFRYEEYTEDNLSSDAQKSIYKREISLVNSLGLLPFDVKDSDFMPKAGVSREECAEAMYRVMGGELLNPTYDNVFSDVNVDGKYATAINHLHKFGIVKGVSQSKFHPSEFITLAEAVTIACRILGYESIAEKKGGFEAGYMSVAAEIKLTDGLIKSPVLTREMLAKFIYNMINADYLKISYFTTQNDVSYDKSKGILSQTRGIHKGRGIVEANYLTSLYSATATAPMNSVIIDNVTYHVGDTDATALIGTKCDFYYRDENEKKVLAVILPCAGVEIKQIEDYGERNIIDLTSQGIEYADEDGEETDISFGSKTNFIYNGVVLTERVENIFTQGTFRGCVRLIDNGRGVETVVIDSYKNIVVESVDTISCKVKDKLSGEAFEIDEKKDIVIFTRNDEKGKLKDVVNGDVAMAYISRNTSGKKFVRFYILNESVSGKITYVDDMTVSVDDVKYRPAPECNVVFSPGIYGTLRLNSKKEIVDFKEDAGDDWSLGLITGVSPGLGGLVSPISVKIYNGKSESVIYQCEDIVTIDGIRFKDPSKALDASASYAGLSDVTLKTAVRYKLSANNKITKLDTVLYGTGSIDDTMTKHTSGANFSYDWNKGIVFQSGQGKYRMDDASTTLFWLGADRQEKDYVLDTPSKILKYPEWMYEDMTLYSSKGEDYEADICIIKGAVDYDYAGKAYLIFDRMSLTLTEDDEEAYKVSGYTEAGEKSYLISKTSLSDGSQIDKVFNNIRKGDVITVSADKDGYVENVQFVVRYDLSGVPEGVSNPRLSRGVYTYGDNLMNERFIYGRVESVSDEGYMVVRYGDETSAPTEVLVATSMPKVIKLTRVNGEIKLHKNLSFNNVSAGDVIFAAINRRQAVMFMIMSDNVL